jgi:hypothetical protein
VSEENDPVKEDAQKLDESPSGLQRRWMIRLKAAKDFFEDFHNEGEVVVKEFLGKGGKTSRLNLFFGNVQTKSATLSGVPKVRARRRFADAKDDVARVSAMALDRILNSDIERESDGYRKALANAKGDWLKPGLGQVWLRYVVETEPTETTDPDTGEVIKGEQKAREDVETDHAKWRDFMWDPSETWEDVLAIFRKLNLTKAEWEKQFPGKPFRVAGRKDGKADEIKEAFGRAEVWEIWDKESKRVLHLCEQERTILKVSPDPYGLPGFFPCPEPLMANVTTSKCIPRSTYYLAKDQYDEAHELQQRIRALVKQVRVRGVYDAGCEPLKDLLTSAVDGRLVPFKSFAALVDKGGIQNAVSLLENKDQIEAILALSQRLALVKQEIYEITAQSDLTRGQSDSSKTATAARGEMRVFSQRVSAEQDEYARFASEAQRIRAFLIAKFFDAETIAQRANIQPDSDDAALLPQAIDLLKSSIADYRIDVDADSLAMTDYDAVQQEGISLMGSVGEYIGKVAPVAAASPGMAMFAAEMLQAMLSGFRGSERFEPIVDRYVSDLKQQAAQPPAPPQPDPAAMAKLEAEKVKAGAAGIKAQAEVVKAQTGLQQTVLDAHAARESFGQRMAERQAAKDDALDQAPLTEGGA